MATKILAKFNVQNIKWALKNEDGTYQTPILYGSAVKMALEPDSSQTIVRSDGKEVGVIVNDKGKTGKMTTNQISEEYEIAMGRKAKTTAGLADINQTKSQEHAIYFETSGLAEDGGYPLAKTWLLGVTSERPAESYDQDTDNPNISTFETSLKIKGVKVLNEDGSEHKDSNSNTVYATKITVIPGDDGFDIFGDTVPTVKIKKQTTSTGG